jgi:hypothetical protein
MLSEETDDCESDSGGAAWFGECEIEDDGREGEGRTGYDYAFSYYG